MNSIFNQISALSMMVTMGRRGGGCPKSKYL